MWVGTITANSPLGALRTVTGYLNADSSLFQSRWSGSTQTITGTIISTWPLYIGDYNTNYTGDVLEIIAWKGVTLTQAEVTSLQTFFENKYYCTLRSSELTPTGTLLHMPTFTP